jgi:CheY-like chemotaxis protein
MKNAKRILIVDDDEDDQLYFRDAINQVNPGIQCEMANNGKEALVQIEIPPPPDLIFLDLNMPVMNGYECLATLKKTNRYKHIPVVIFTTSKNSMDIERSQNLGASLFLTKPSNFTILCNKLRTILEFDLSSLQFTI